MTVKLNSIERWTVLEAGSSINFAAAAEGARRVRLNVNCANPTTFYFENAEGPRLLAAVPAGVDVIEFNADGAFAVFPQEGAGEVHYQTAEAEATAHHVVDPVIFTKLAQRRHRNPELEEMMFRMQQNMERRLALQANEIAAALDARMEARNVETAPAGTPASDAGGKVSEQEPDGTEPGEGTGSEDGGEQPGGS